MDPTWLNKEDGKSPRTGKMGGHLATFGQRLELENLNLKSLVTGYGVALAD